MFSTNGPAAAYLDAETDLKVRAESRCAWNTDQGDFPALYLSHGAPPLFEDAGWIEALARWADSLPRPRGIVIVSAHWESAPISLSATQARVPLVYDFGGFHPYYYSMTYPTPDAGWLGQRIAGVLADSMPVTRHANRGLDHGAWVPLKVMYPGADIPVVQMSIPTHDPGTLLKIGERLRPLRQEGIAIIGSGFGTHGLPFLGRENLQLGVVPSWSRDFDLWAAELLADGDVEELARYATQAPGMPYAHPTVEHFSPIFVTLGAAEDPEAAVQPVLEDFVWGLARRSFQVK